MEMDTFDLGRYTFERADVVVGRCERRLRRHRQVADKREESAGCAKTSRGQVTSYVDGDYTGACPNESASRGD